MNRRRSVTVLSLGAALALAAGLGLAGPAAGTGPPSARAGCDCAKAGRAAGDECCCGPAARTDPYAPLLLTVLRGSGQDEKKAEGKKAGEKAGEAALAKGDAARKALVGQREALAKDGVWDCCIEPGCVFCQTAADGCPCEMNLKKGSAVCPECWGGWQAGQGQVKGVDPRKVPLPSRDLLKKLYDMKAEKLKKAEAGEK